MRLRLKLRLFEGDVLGPDREPPQCMVPVPRDSAGSEVAPAAAGGTFVYTAWYVVVLRPSTLRERGGVVRPVARAKALGTGLFSFASG